MLAILLEEMRKPAEDRLEWLFWHDADTILLNPHIPLSLFLPPAPHAAHIHLLVSADPRGLTNGVILLRIHPWSISLLTALLAYPHLHPGTPLPYRDQSAMALVLALPPFRTYYTDVPQRWFNAYAADRDDDRTHKVQVRPGDLLVHFAGCPVRERERVMGKWFARSEGGVEGEEWAVEAQKTSLPGEVERFWGKWVEEEEERRREREGVRGECDGVGRRVEGWLREFGEGMEGRERDTVWEALKGLKAKIEDEEVDTQELKEGMEELMEVARPLRLLVAEAKRALTRDAHALVVEAERFLLDGNIAREPEIALRLEEMVAKLRELLAREPDDGSAIQSCMDELRQVAQDFAVQADRENKDEESREVGGREVDGREVDGREVDGREVDGKDSESMDTDSKDTDGD